MEHNGFVISDLLEKRYGEVFSFEMNSEYLHFKSENNYLAIHNSGKIHSNSIEDIAIISIIINRLVRTKIMFLNFK